MRRNHILDSYRGLTIISMVLFHLMYDITLYRSVDWYEDPIVNQVWQLSIACSFFMISGIASNFLSREKNIKRGLILNLIGFVITLITYIFARDIMIVFGVMNGLGCSMIITGLIQNRVEKGNNLMLLSIMLLLFIGTYKISSGKAFGLNIPSEIYNFNLFPIGFPKPEFESSDYFGMIPWVFMYLAGFFKGRYLKERDFYGVYGTENILSKIGKHSLLIYLTHQLIIFLIVEMSFKMWG
ncbi:Uncharacterized membrane protein [Peptoniphilus asaccharolyticus DSM 20463]|uniref:Uncharacterized membrane protein n=1 Tax=Peptoniphilus asaccharolyticus DSM 20463 TaxID=573058 RepID=A0A1W1V1W4_PEPAS|nr:heparan-alpha-glucosaminide N-acetyltransferase domain-containing protein [Peptoniphilus asaccharolyticus]MBL7576025.1 DUF1624 domain-containing protein [Peptoniphilus asaccharolyticus]SMB87276.1 Uncharacterized membrane protein [Peptoniphilus asaccharolyticus DSM 20463]